MNHRIIYTDPDNAVTYTLVYKQEDPAAIQIVGPRKGAGVLIPARALDYLMTVYRLHTIHDIFEHQATQEDP